MSPVNEAAEWHTAYIGLGSNLGDRERLLAEAVIRLHRSDGIRVEAVSPLYETEPVGVLEQPPFLNMAARVATTRSPHSLLKTMLDIERELGRVRTIRWGPRTVDLDLLLYDTVELATEELILPHPRMRERAFVMIPLADVLSDPNHPQARGGPSFEQNRGVKLWKTIGWAEEYGLFGN